MSPSVTSPPDVSGIASTLAALRSCGILSADWDAVRAYFEKHADLAPLLPSVCARARTEFGQGTELALELYKDPEIDDRFLTLYVRQMSYDPTIMDGIESVNRQFDLEMEKASGYFLVATDFRRPKEKHGV